RGGDVDRVRREALLRQLEGDAGARRGLEEEVDDRLAAKDGDLLDRALADLLEGLGGIQDRADLGGVEELEPDQVLPQRWCGAHHPSPPSGVRSSTASR